MIERFQDHAANERTLLSWTRTAITIAGVGILIEKLPNTQPAAGTGMLLVGLSALLVLFSTVRFLAIRRQLNRQHADDTLFGWIEVLFTSMLALLLGTMFVFLLRLVQ
jgi:putative membrane protein